jgi:hypothetical protein
MPARCTKLQKQQRVITLLPRQGQYPLHSQAATAMPPPDRRIVRIAELLAHDAPGLTPPSENHP